MRYQANHKQKTREAVLSHAARMLQAEGPDGLSIAAVMEEVGLTHGGFYAHFASKDALVAATIAHLFELVRDRWAHETLDREPAAGLAAYVDWYLSPAHRDGRATGCPLAALAADLPRMSAPCRAAFSIGARKILQLIEKLLVEMNRPAPAATALSVVAEMVGAVSLARLEADPARADAMLATSRTAIKRRLGLGAPQKGLS